MNELDELTFKLTQVARKYLPKGLQEGELDLDADLFSLGLDSLTITQFILDLEQTFSVQFPDAALCAESFRTVRGVANTVMQTRG